MGVKDAAKGLWERGRRALMAMVDVKSAYRNVPIHPDDRWMMGMLWEGALYIDTILPFGLRSAPQIFTAITAAVEWIAKQERVTFIIHYLDDFLVIGAPASPECSMALATLLRVFNGLGLPVAINKLEGPAPCLMFLGFELDSEAMVIPQRKLGELQRLIHSWVGRRYCTREELDSMVGMLSHASTVVQPGKPSCGGCTRYLLALGWPTITFGWAYRSAQTCYGGPRSWKGIAFMPTTMSTILQLRQAYMYYVGYRLPLDMFLASH